METRVVRNIRLRPEDAKEFVSVASRCSFDIDIAYNRYVVDAKSIVGVLGLDFNQVLTVSYAGYHADFENFLKAFAMAC